MHPATSRQLLRVLRRSAGTPQTPVGRTPGTAGAVPSARPVGRQVISYGRAWSRGLKLLRREQDLYIVSEYVTR